MTRLGRDGRRVMLRAVVALVLLTGGAALVADPAAAQATSIVVNSTGDRPDVRPGDGQCRTSAGACSLRAAIDEANAQPGPNTITFAIGGSGVKTIAITDTLVINDQSGPTTIDGYTQRGAAPNTAARASNAKISVEITTSTTPWPMILIESPGNTLRGLAVYGNGPRIELRGEQADGNRIAGNFIGTDATGTATSKSPHDNRDLWMSDAGVAMNLGPDRNVIGGPDRADRNVISGNDQWGIRINHGETSENVVENNIIGPTPDLRSSLRQKMGLDIQWWTWGNYVTDNLISGHYWYGVDLSHGAVGNVIVGNRFGTGGGGNGGTAALANNVGIAFKDDPTGNVVADNVIANSVSHGIWHKHNYTGANTVVGNRIGVGSQGAALGNGGYGIQLRGHDDLYVDNVIANNTAGGVYVTNSTPARPGPATSDPDGTTLGNAFHQNTFYNTPFPFLDIESSGPNQNDARDRDDGAHLLLNHPEITGIGPGRVFGTVCAHCRVEVYVSGAVQADGTLRPGVAQRGKGAAWIGSAEANGRGRFSLADDRVRADKQLMLVAVDADGNTSEFSPRRRVPATFDGSGAGTNAAPSVGRVAQPAVPDRPAAHVADRFGCRLDGNTLAWDDAGAPEYYVFFSVGGIERYVGPVSARSVAVPPADSYRVEHWVSGFAANARCGGDGAATFSCSWSNGTLRWTDAGASEYYAFATTNGNERYVGPVRGTSVRTARADSYRVEHWVHGPVTNGVCRP